MMLTLNRSVAALLVLVAATIAVTAARAQGPIALHHRKYQTVTMPPFNGQLAFYVGDVLPGSTTVQILIGNGRRPFAVDTGTMQPDEFETYVAALKRTAAIRVVPFQVQKAGQRMAFQYLSKSFTVTVVELSPGRIALTVAGQ